MLAGLYLSKFDSGGLRQLGFGSFAEAFNVIGSALGARPASLKNYRDEFDPLFPNERKGWHKRPIRGYCKAVYDAYGALDLRDFTNLLKRIVYSEPDLDLLIEKVEEKVGENRSFARRLLTGQAAEQYFKSKYREIDIFSDCELEDTTNLGCGFDFRLSSSTDFYGVEVKGLNEPTGSVVLTDKEHSAAEMLRGSFFLFVVKNFRDTPFHELHRDPLAGRLAFKRAEQRMVQISWTANV